MALAASTLVVVHADAPPVGSVEVTTSPEWSTATQRPVEGQEIASIANMLACAVSLVQSTNAGLDHVVTLGVGGPERTVLGSNPTLLANSMSSAGMRARLRRDVAGFACLASSRNVMVVAILCVFLRALLPTLSALAANALRSARNEAYDHAPLCSALEVLPGYVSAPSGA